jgi:hypothetical protein
MLQHVHMPKPLQSKLAGHLSVLDHHCIASSQTVILPYKEQQAVRHRFNCIVFSSHFVQAVLLHALPTRCDLRLGTVGL